MTDLVKLPAWSTPADLDSARESILQLALSTAENAYSIGRHLRWVKEQLPHGEFGPWLADNVRLFSERTGQRYMDFAERCDSAGALCDYRTKSDTVSDLNAGAAWPEAQASDAKGWAERFAAPKALLLDFVAEKMTQRREAARFALDHADGLALLPKKQAREYHSWGKRWGYLLNEDAFTIAVMRMQAEHLAAFVSD